MHVRQSDLYGIVCTQAVAAYSNSIFHTVGAIFTRGSDINVLAANKAVLLCSGGNIYRVIAVFADSSIIAPEFIIIYKWYCVTKLRSYAAPSHSKLCSPFT